jgi:hypothetical protein
MDWLALSWFVAGLALGALAGLIYPLALAWRWIRRILQSIEVKREKKGE